MQAGIRRGVIVLVLAGAACARAGADQPAYRCGKGQYADVPCGRALGVSAPRRTDKWKQPPQDRAVVAKRARLSEDARQECSALDARLVEEQQVLHGKGDAATLQDEMPLVQAKKRFRELKC